MLAINQKKISKPFLSRPLIDISNHLQADGPFFFL
jgi:hypothetical protein